MTSTRSLHLPHDGGELAFELPERSLAGVARAIARPAPPSLESLFAAAVSDPVGSAPLAERVRAGQKVAVLFDDATRPTPTAGLFALLVAELRRAGIAESDIYPVYGPGLHRPPNPRPAAKYGNLFSHPNIVVHDYKTSGLAFCGITPRGTPVFVNDIVERVDFRVSLGHIVPHMDAGFGGGGKIVLPGISGKPTVEQNHALMITTGSRLGKTDGNPVREDMDEAGRLAGLDFIVNTITDPDGRVTAIAAGDPVRAHRWGCGRKTDLFAYRLDEPVDVAVVVQPDGFLSGAMAAMLWADRAVRLGGTIVVVAPARKGWSDPAAVEARLAADEGLMRKSAAELAWIVADRDVQALRLATSVFDYRRAMLEKRVVLVSDGFDRAATEALGMHWASSAATALAEALEFHGADARVLFMPEATRTLPVLPRLEGVVWPERQVWSDAAPTERQPDHA